MATLTTNQTDKIPVGSIRTFGKYGNPYIVLDTSEQDENGKIWVKIQLLETGRIDQYSLNSILLDPEAE